MSNNTKEIKPPKTFVRVSGHTQLPIDCSVTVKRHVNSIYVGSIVRLYDKICGIDGHLVTVH